MTTHDQVRTRHDEWIKRALSLWLAELGDVDLDVRIAGQSRRGDVLYTERRNRPARRKKLGALGEIARGVVLFEVSRNPFTQAELKSCVFKGVELEAREFRAARRTARRLSTVAGPTLCAITPSMSDDFAKAAGATPMPGRPGLHVLAPMWRTVIVVANELPKVSRGASTLWLRLLGRGSVQAEAVQELLEMSEQEPLRDATLSLLVAWRQSLPPSLEQSEEQQEMTMNLEQAYMRWEKKTLARGKAQGKAEGRVEGKAEGRVEGKAEMLLTVLSARGLSVTAAQRRVLLGCIDGTKLDSWARAAVTTPSVEALLAGGSSRRAGGKRARAPRRSS